MTAAARDRRATWLRRTRVLTGWVASAGVVVTLLIAAVVGSASPAKKVTLTRRSSRIERAPAERRVHFRRAQRRRLVVRRHLHVAAHTAPPVRTTSAPAPTVTPPPAPTPAPSVVPVIVSGGS